MSFTTNKQPPLLVSVVAGAMSSIGFGMSVAAIWIVWLLPTAKPVVPIIPRQRKQNRARRRSEPLPIISSTAAFQSPLQSPIPAILIPIDAPPAEKALQRRVYFIESQTRVPTPRRYPVPAENNCAHDDQDDNVQATPEQPESSPKSSSSTLVTPPVTPPAEVEESDTSSTRASQRGFRLPKIIRRKARATPGGSMDGYASQSDDRASVKRSNTITLPVWPLGRPRRGSDVDSVSSLRLPFKFPGIRAPAGPSSRPSTPPPPPVSGTPATAMFSRRTPSHHRRPSGSTTARTQPYDFPYFATPPTVAVDLSDCAAVISRPQTPSAESARGRDVHRLGVPDLGGPNFVRPIHKRRSASTGWINKQ